MKIHGVVFDLDGTLVDSALDFAAMRRDMQLPAGQPILEAFEAAVEADSGTLRVVVRSARQLPAPIVKRLRSRLAEWEGKSIALSTEVAPALLGGVQVVITQWCLPSSRRSAV